MLRLTLPFALILISPLAFAESRDERLAVATEYTEATVKDMDFAALVRQIYQPLIQQIEASGRTLSEAQVAEIDTLYRDTMVEPMRELLLKQAVTMADVYTLEEIEALRDFYSTEAGRAAILKLPEIMAVQQPQVLALIEDRIPAMLPEIQAIVEGG